MNSAIDKIISIIVVIIFLAIIAVLVSPNAKTSQVIQSFGALLTNLLSAVTAPITGATTNSSSNGAPTDAVTNLFPSLSLKNASDYLASKAINQ